MKFLGVDFTNLEIFGIFLLAVGTYLLMEGLFLFFPFCIGTTILYLEYKKKGGDLMNHSNAEELFPCNVCGGSFTRGQFSQEPTSFDDSPDNCCIDCEKKAIKCPSCGLLGTWAIDNEDIIHFSTNTMTIVGHAPFDKILGLKCKCGQLIGESEEVFK